MLPVAKYSVMLLFASVASAHEVTYRHTSEGLVPSALSREDMSPEVAAPPLSPLEKKFMEFPSIASVKANLRYITAVDHVAGTAGSLRDAEYVRDKMIEYGLNSTIESYDVELNYPAEAATLTMGDYVAPLAEAIVEGDADTDNYWRNHTFNGYAPSGDVTGQMVYANYGLPSDFDELARAGVSVKGRVVLMRYGNCFRGLKALNAQQLGAVGAVLFRWETRAHSPARPPARPAPLRPMTHLPCVLCCTTSDPADDGYTKGTTYDKGGPWRPETGVQRGSVQFLSLCPGDPNRVYLNASTPFGHRCECETALRPSQQHPQMGGGGRRGEEKALRPQARDRKTCTASLLYSPSLPSPPPHTHTPYTRSAPACSVEDVCGYSADQLRPLIPVLPVSWGDAQPLLRAMGGPAPANTTGFQGGLPFQYRLGPTPAGTPVHLKTNNTFGVHKIWNVLSTIDGALAGSADDRAVLVGNHRDAWVYGAADPNR
jgi:N-acetylated-alpha-linked acidic dipeptidase